jgi:hypothetical protein
MGALTGPFGASGVGGASLPVTASYSLAFASTAYVNAGTSLASFIPAAAFSFSCWVELTTTTGALVAMLFGNDSISPGWGAHLTVLSGNAVFQVVTTSGGAAGYNATGATILSTGAWYHLCGTWDGTNNLKVYVNGVVDGTGTSSNTHNIRSSTVSPILLGCTTSSLTGAFSGNIADPRVYGGSLNATAVAELASGQEVSPVLAGHYPLIGYWPLSEGTGTTTANLSNYLATTAANLVNSPTWSSSVPSQL